MNVLGKNKNFFASLSAALIFATVVTACGSSNNSANVANPDQNDSGSIADGQVALTSINGSFDSNQSKTLNVHPGDMITLSADILSPETGQVTYTRVEAFRWQVDGSSSDVCDAGASQDCLANSNFQVNDYGVAYYVPSTIGKEMTITVSKRGEDTNATSLTLVNADYTEGTYTPPTEVVTEPSTYHEEQLNPDLALNGQGHWVYVNGTRYWSPKAYVTDGEDEWSPYRNGYWTWDASQQSMVWISYDPWGWMTDHYGYWRYHGVYGWIWSAFAGSDYYYHPHCVSWFDDGSGYIGWYPYHSAYSRGYRDGFEHGFRDGFWLGFQVGATWGHAGYGYHPGYTIVQYGHFTHQNIVQVYQHTRGNAVVTGVINSANMGNHYGAMPRSEIRTHLGTIPGTRILSNGRGNVRYAETVHTVPPRYTQIASTIRTNAIRRNPVGSVIDARGSGAVVIAPPTSNGRGVVHPPMGHNSQGEVVSMPPQTTHTAQVNPRNPQAAHHVPAPAPSTPTTRPVITHPVPVPAPPRQPPTHPAPTHPAPTHPAPTHPAPTQPAPTHPAPTHPAPTQPAPTHPAPTHPAPTYPAPTHPAPAPSHPAPTQPTPRATPRPHNTANLE